MVNAYTQWLGLPDDCLSPNYYQILGLAEFENDRERIRNNAMQRMAQVRKYQLGPDAEQALRIIAELSEAFGCLSDSQRKAAYDEQLRRQTGGGGFNLALLETAATEALAPASLPPPHPAAGATAAAHNTPHSARPRVPLIAAGATGIVLLLALVIALFGRSGASKESNPVSSSSATDSSAAKDAAASTEPPPPRPAVGESAADMALRKGKSSLEAKDYDLAIAHFDEAIRLDPANSAAFLQRGIAHARNGNGEASAKDLDEALRLGPDTAEAYYWRARLVLLGLGNREANDAIADLSHAIRLKADYTAAYIDRGWAYMDVNDDQRALKDLSEAIRLDPANVQARFDRGTIYSLQADGEEQALADFNEVLKLDPKHSLALAGRGWLFAQSGDYAKALQDLNQSIALNPTSAHALTRRGRVHGALDDDTRALADFTEALRHDPVYSEALRCRADLYARTDDLEHAVADYTACLQAAPDDVEAWSGRALALHRQGDSQLALSDYGEAIRLAPGIARHYRLRGLLYGSLGQEEQARSDFSELIRLAPDDPENYKLRAMTYENSHDYPRALADYSQALKLAPDDTVLLLARATLFESLNEYESALVDYSSWIRADPKDPDAYLLRGGAYFQLDQNDKAIADFDEALKLDPELQDAYHGRGAAYEMQENYERAIADYTKALELDEKDHLSLSGRGHARASQAKYREAIVDLEAAIALDPSFANSDWVQRAECYKQLGDTNPEKALALYDRGATAGAQKKFVQAINLYREAAKLDKRFPWPANNLAWIYATCSDPSARNPGGAMTYATQAVEAYGAYWGFLDTLAAACARNQHFAEAIVYLEKAARLAPEEELPGISKRMAEYREARPHVDLDDDAEQPTDSAAPKRPAIPANAVLALTFDNDSIVKEAGKTYARDSSRRANHGLLHGATWTQEGKIGGALSFDGDDDIELSDRAFPTGNAARTISCWFKARPAGRIMVLFFAGRKAALDGCYLALTNSLVVGNWGGGPTERVGSTAVVDDRWHFVAMAFDGREVRLYLDGKLELSHPRTYGTTATGALRIGSSGQDHFVGMVDEFYVFDRALSEAEVRGLYDSHQAGSGSTTPEPVPAAAPSVPAAGASNVWQFQIVGKKYQGTLWCFGESLVELQRRLGKIVVIWSPRVKYQVGPVDKSSDISHFFVAELAPTYDKLDLWSKGAIDEALMAEGVKDVNKAAAKWGLRSHQISIPNVGIKQANGKVLIIPLAFLDKEQRDELVAIRNRVVSEQ